MYYAQGLIDRSYGAQNLLLRTSPNVAIVCAAVLKKPVYHSLVYLALLLLLLFRHIHRRRVIVLIIAI